MELRARPIGDEVYWAASDITAFLRRIVDEWRAFADQVERDPTSREAASMAGAYIRDTADQLDCAAVEYATGWDEAYAHRMR